jgi:hypothetical protein
MGPGLKTRQAQTAARCKEFLRAAHTSQSALVEEFIAEVEGAEPEVDITRWGQFADPSHSTEAMLKRLDSQFNRWLNGEV